MATLGDDIEKFIDESMPFLFEKLGDTSGTKKHGCLTLAQCALLMPAMITAGMTGDASEIAAHYIQLALLDVAHGELNPKHPETRLPYSQYKRMTEAGMFGIDGAALPLPTADWLVTLDEAERWLLSKDIYINFDGLRSDLARMKAEGLDDWPSHDQADTPAAGETPPGLQQDEGVRLKKPLQEKAILTWLITNGFDPKNLPERDKGRCGPKSRARIELLKNHALFTAKSFEKIWQSLRDDEEIIGAR